MVSYSCMPRAAKVKRKTTARLSGMVQLKMKRQGSQAATVEMKTATHGADEGRLDLQKSVLRRQNWQKFCESATARPYDAVTWGQRLPNS